MKNSIFHYLHKITLLIIMMGFISSCGEKYENQYQKTLIQAQEALNNEDFNKALNLLEGLKDNKEVNKLRSMAYAGRAGFNSLIIADMISNNQGKDPVKLFFELSRDQYKENSINDLNLALKQIQILYPDVGNRPDDLRSFYGLIQTYKASQIIFKNVNNKIDKCEIVEFISDDLIEIILSLHSATVSLKNYVESIDTFFKKISIELNLPESEIEIEQQLDNFKQKLQEKINEKNTDCSSSL